MSNFDPQKLSVKLIPPATHSQPVVGRKYTLTHSDITAELFLDIGNVYNYEAINQMMRDEVLAEWKQDKQGQLNLTGNVYVDGGEFGETISGIRFNVFNKEMDTALKGIVYGDLPFYNNYPNLLDAPIFIKFESTYPQYRQVFYYGTPRQYLIQVNETKSENMNCISEAELELKSNWRLIWEQHINWTRMAIISLTFMLPDVNFVITRLLRNATDMGDLLKPYYGEEIANQFGSLVKEHLVIAADLVKAAIAGNETEAAEIERKWYANADDISLFLSRINPYLPYEEVRQMFYDHLELTKQEAVSMITMDYEKDIAIFDEIETQALGMADAISNAIVKQFPNKFT